MSAPSWFASYEAGVPRTCEYPPLVVHDFLQRSAERFPDHPALVFFGTTLTYRQLNGMADRLGHWLVAQGVKKGDRVALFLPNLPQTVAAYYGVLKMGGVVVQTNPLYTEEELAFQMNDCEASVVITLDLLYEKVKAVQAHTKIRTAVFVRVQDFLPVPLKWLYPLKAMVEKKWVSLKAGPGLVDFMEIMSDEPSETPHAVVSPSDLALIQYTGGTTGKAKGAMLSHANLVANTVQIKAWLPDFQDGKEVMMGAIPFFHVYGMTVCLNLSMMGGATIVVFPRFMAKDVLGGIVKYRATIFPGVPAMYAAINNIPGVEKFNMTSIRACISGAGALLRPVQERFEGLTGGKLVEGYGLTEASPVTHCNPVRGVRQLGSIGIPLPDTEAIVMDVETGTKEVAIGEVGELCVKGPQVMQGYWKRPEETAAALRGGWLHTGDIVRRDDAGFFFMVDRKKEMIKTRGENVYPRDIEEVLVKHPLVAEASVIGLPDERLGEKIRAYVVPRSGAKPTPEELLKHCGEHLAKFQVPHEIRFRDALPKTIIGKVLRRVLVEEARQEK